MVRHAYGYIPDLPDRRDHQFRVAGDLALPPMVDLRNQDSPIEDQGSLGSCTSFAVGAAIRFCRRKEGLPDFITSHLFLYYNSRSWINKGVDSGATLRDAVKAAAKYGDCPETDWPYVPYQFALKPSFKAYQDASQDRALKYQRIPQNIQQMKNCLAQGFPFVVGVSVYGSFENQQAESTGFIPLPKNSESLLGGHALLVLGYRDIDLHFIVRNSWGTKFGDGGYIYLPYAYLQDDGLASDFWCIQAVGKQ